MSYEFSTLCYIRFLSEIFALFLTRILWKQRNSNGVIYLMLFELSAAVWAIGDGFESAGITLQTKILWAQFSYIGTPPERVVSSALHLMARDVILYESKG